MNRILFFVLGVALSTGCKTGTESIVRSEITIRHGTNSMTISNPKDVEFEDAMISPVDGVVRIKKYRSAANVPALHAAEVEAQAKAQIFSEFRQEAREWRDTALRAYGIPVPQREPVQPLLSVETQKSPVPVEPGKTNLLK